jgi:uncharacterized protein (DUF2147 family)
MTPRGLNHIIMKKLSILFFFLALLITVNGFGQGLLGVWKTIDDKTGEPKSHVEIYKKGNKYFGKVVKLLPTATTKICNDCPGDKKGKSLIDLDILWDMKDYKDYWSYGKIVDPADGKVYKCNISLEGNDMLKVRGYIGFSLLGRTQTWYRVK